MTALAKNSGGALARPHETSYFTREQIDTLKNVLCPGLTDAELNLVGEVVKQTGLSPFAKQLYVTKRWDGASKMNKLTIQTGIDGYRLIAERTGKYMGQRPHEWCGMDGVWRDVWLTKQPPAAARVTVLKAGSEPFVAVARFDAYVQTKQDGGLTHMWAKMGPEQLAKCAEALALRKAFPQELSSVYTQEEMEQADNPTLGAAIAAAEYRGAVIEAPPRAPQLSAQTRQREESSSGTTPAPLPLRTSKNYPVKEFAECPFADLPDAALSAYLAYYNEKLPLLTQPNHVGATKATILAAEAELERRLAEEGQPLPEDNDAVLEVEGQRPGVLLDATTYDPETGEVLDHPPSDDLEEKLRASVEMTRAGVEWGNTNESLGLVGADAPANQSKRTTRKGAA